MTTEQERVTELEVAFARIARRILQEPSLSWSAKQAVLAISSELAQVAMGMPKEHRLDAFASLARAHADGSDTAIDRAL